MKAAIKAKPELTVIKGEKIVNLLKPGEVGPTLELIVRDKSGKITDHRGPMRSKSFVRQFLELLWVTTYQIPDSKAYSMIDPGGTYREIHATGYCFRSSAPAGTVTYGIIVGTGTTAPTIDDYAIETLIDHDAAPPTAGALQYGAVAFGAPSSDATTSQFTITRNFANASGGAITVNEIALYVEGYDTAVRYFMTIRDVIGGGIAVPDGQTLTINYRPQAAV